MRNRTHLIVVVFILFAGRLTASHLSADAAPPEELERDPVALNVVIGLEPGKGIYDGVVGKPNDPLRSKQLPLSSASNYSIPFSPSAKLRPAILARRHSFGLLEGD